MQPKFNKFPAIQVNHREGTLIAGWENILARIQDEIKSCSKKKVVVVVECYQGVLHEDIIGSLIHKLNPDHTFYASDSFLAEEVIQAITHEYVTDDRVFGYMTSLNMTDLFDRAQLERHQKKIQQISEGLVVVYGHGAALFVSDPDILVYADMARWEIQQRMRSNKVSNIGLSNKDEHAELKYKRGFFVDWRLCDRLKKEIFSSVDYFMDTNDRERPKMVSGNAFREGLEKAVKRPFSVVPFFDEGPWGGQWLKEVCDLDRSADNYAWCFNCVPEENSVLLGFGNQVFETPAINLVFFQPEALLGKKVRALFGDEFPIRFDYLDTMDGGNLSLQVHPLTSYIREKFGMHYTQDESYYLMDVKPGGKVFLGLKENINPQDMMGELLHSESNGEWFDAGKYVESWPAKKHDHMLIPAGTIHCSGKNSVVLEISATPYIFTFKLWDWGRMGLDGRPRPTHVQHGINNIQWDRDKKWTEKNLINKTETLMEADGWTEEKTGLHELEFIETRRHWFTKKVTHNTNGGVNVLTLVEGDVIVVESPEGAFPPFTVNYAETFIVPAVVGQYTIRPARESAGESYATIKAFVRTHE